jgi:hypothetical protein
MANNNNTPEETLLKIYDKLVAVEIATARVEADLKEHMRRTTLLEIQTEFLKKNVYMAYGAIGLIGLMGVLIKIVEFVSR